MRRKFNIKRQRKNFNQFNGKTGYYEFYNFDSKVIGYAPMIEWAYEIEETARGIAHEWEDGLAPKDKKDIAMICFNVLEDDYEGGFEFACASVFYDDIIKEIKNPSDYFTNEEMTEIENHNHEDFRNGLRSL
jgi:hypothetical protein